MRESDTIKATVRAKYGRVASGGEASCCGPSGCGSDDLSMIGDAYDEIDGYFADADLRLGCGLPTEHDGLQPGDTVLDLGAGAGLDAFVARRIVGGGGRVIGVDMTPEMVTKARANAEQLGYGNVEFLLGDIEDLPLDAETVDVVISNCVLNLVPDKQRAFAEIYRVLRPGGHFCISDVVVRGTLPEAVRRSAEWYVGCVAGAMERSSYLDVTRAVGFADVKVLAEKDIAIPDATLPDELDARGRMALQQPENAVLSVTVHGERPS